MSKQDMVKKLTERTIHAWEFLQYAIESERFSPETIKQYRLEWMTLENTCRLLGIKVNYPT